MTMIMTDEQREQYSLSIKRNFAPIDPMWEKAATWCRMSSKPVVVKLNTPDNNYYVVSSTRVWTHRTFTALVGAARWTIHPSPTMKAALYNEALTKNMVGKNFENTEDPDTMHYWWGQSQRELTFNCLEWLREITDNELLQFIDIKNVKFSATHTDYRTDGYTNNIKVTDYHGNICEAVRKAI